MWYHANGTDLNKTANTTHFTGSNGLYNIRSILRIRAETNETYLCMFWIEELNTSTSAVLQIKGRSLVFILFNKFQTVFDAFVKLVPSLS